MNHSNINPSEEVLFRVLTGSARDTEEEWVSAWRRRAPGNEARYQTLAAILELAARADASRHQGVVPRAETIVAKASLESGRMAGPATQRASRRWLFGGLAAAAVVILALGITRFIPGTPPEDFGPQEFVTGSLESATVSLRDGTVVRLAPNSRLVILSNTDRAVALTGRAYFAVARDEDRPFRVQTTAGDVKVLGTRFNLEADGEDLRVVVVEGTVALAGNGEDALVEAGEMGRVVRGRQAPVVRIPNPESHVEWTGRFLAFQETPFRDAVLEVERQYGVDFDVQGAELEEHTITAWFADWTLEEVLDVLCPVVNAECTQVNDVVTAVPRTR
jgi:transmembrane sensor